MEYKFNKKTIRIPDDYIKNAMIKLELTKEEAVQMYLEDEGYLENEEQTALIEKTKNVKINHDAKAIKERKKTERQPKVDEPKENFIKLLAEFCGGHCENVAITNKSKMVEFDMDGDHYKLDLIRTRKPKT